MSGPCDRRETRTIVIALREAYPDARRELGGRSTLALLVMNLGPR